MECVSPFYKVMKIMKMFLIALLHATNGIQKCPISPLFDLFKINIFCRS